MQRLRILITNTALVGFSGTETYVRDLAVGLLRRGHLPIVYSTYLGDMADELHRATIPVVDDLATLAAPPDVIHGHHLPETLTALLRYPGVPAIHLCHDWSAWHDAPLRFPRVRRHVVVDCTCRDRLLGQYGLADEQVRVLFNAVDLVRFRPRGPLPKRPRRALVFSNYLREQNGLAVVREACAGAGLRLEVKGSASGNPCAQPEQVLGQYDLIFAKARCALEALAVGAAVVLCDVGRCGPLVTSRGFDELRAFNFGRRAICTPLSADALASAISGYDPGDAAAVSQRVRAESGLDGLLDQLLALYQDVIQEQRQAALDDPWAESVAAAAAVRSMIPYYREIRQYHDRAIRAETECIALRSRLRRLPGLVRMVRTWQRWLRGSVALVAPSLLLGSKNSSKSQRQNLPS